MSETHESGDFDDILAPSGGGQSKTVTQQNLKISSFFHYFAERYNCAGGQNVIEIARFERFRQRRYFQKKNYQKRLSFKKVTANLICGLIENIRLRHSGNYAISVGTAQEYFLILTDSFSDCVSISQSDFFCRKTQYRYHFIGIIVRIAIPNEVVN